MSEKIGGSTRDWVIGAEDEPRGPVPLLVGLMGPSGGGKTYSALRLATGMQEITGGDIYGIDTESGRMKHYKDKFKFRHVPFGAPFSSAAYLDVLRLVVAQGAKVIVVDSMSHEHSGEGGYLDFHDQELNKFAGNDQVKRDKNNMRAWIEPSKERQKLITGILQLDANFIFTFRAKETVKPDGGGKVQELGFMPIAGDVFLYEMTVCALLMPVSGGVPTWQSKMPGERMMIKAADQFAPLFAGQEGQPLNEAHGRGLARWAKGEDIGPPASMRQTQASPPPPPSPPADPGWDHAAWAKAFEEALGEPKNLADFDAVWGDESNRDLLMKLAELDVASANRLKAAAGGKRKALKSLEQQKIGDL